MPFVTVIFTLTMATCSSRALLAALTERGPLDVGSLSEVLAAHPITVAQQCDELQAAGYVRQIASGVYVITDSGEEHLSQLSEPSHRE